MGEMRNRGSGFGAMALAHYPCAVHTLFSDVQATDGAHQVLSPWSEEESSDLPNKMKESVKIIESWMHSGLQRTMTSFN